VSVVGIDMINKLANKFNSLKMNSRHVLYLCPPFANVGCSERTPRFTLSTYCLSACVHVVRIRFFLGTCRGCTFCEMRMFAHMHIQASVHKYLPQLECISRVATDSFCFRDISDARNSCKYLANQKQERGGDESGGEIAFHILKTMH